MAEHGWKWLETAGHGLNQLEIDGNGQKYQEQLETAGNDLKWPNWQEIDGIGWKWLEMTRIRQKWLEYPIMAVISYND